MRQELGGGPVSENVCACGHVLKFVILKEAGCLCGFCGARYFTGWVNDIKGSLGRLLSPGPFLHPKVGEVGVGQVPAFHFS